jgi:hypothetical protein
MVVLSIGLLLAVGAQAQEKDFRVKVEANEVAANEAFRISFKLNGKGRDFEPPSFKYFDVEWGPAKSLNRRIVNGNFSMTMSYSYKLKPKRKGSYRIGPATIVKDAQTLTTDAVSIKVTESNRGQNSRQARKKDRTAIQRIQDNLYIKCMVDNTEPYRGEQIRATYKLFINVGVSDYEVKATPQFNGFWKEVIKDPEKFNVRTERVEGERFKTAVLSKVALFPQRAGKLRLDPFKMKFDVRYRDDGDNERGFSRFRRNYKTKTLTISSSPVSIDVKPLPGGAPASFSGLVGEFDLSSSLERKQAKMNEPVSLKLTLAGTGNFNKVQPPDLTIPPTFDTYDPETNNQVSAKSGQVKGSKTFKYLLIPRSPGQHELDPLTVTYFNPNEAEYITETTPAFDIRVRPGQGGADSTVAARSLLPRQQSVQTIDKDIRYIQAEAGNLSKEPAGFTFSAPFWGLAIAPFLLVGSIAYFRQQEGTAEATRAQRAQKLAQEQLKAASKALEDEAALAFYESLSWALWGYAGDKLSIPVAEMTQDHLQSRFQEKGVSQYLIQELLSLIRYCEEATYTPNGERMDRQNLYRQAEKLITDLEAELKQV